MRLGRPVAVLLAVAAVTGGGPAGALPAEFVDRGVFQLEFPTSVAFTPDGRTMFVSERSGRIRVAERGALRAEPFATVRTTTSGEGGLLGIAVHPEFHGGEPWVYAFHTLPDMSADVVVRFRASGLRSAESQTIMRLVRPAFNHHGGILAFGPDHMLYVSHGDQARAGDAQDPKARRGKIYRLQPDGRVPADNPFAGSPTWAYGIRNPFGLAFAPGSGLLYETENGPNDHDEINLIERGKNYGWPVVKGKSGDRRFVDPLVDYVRIVVPTGVAVLAAPFPEAMRGDLIVGTFQAEQLRRIHLSSDGRRVERDEILATGRGVVGATMGPDAIYYTTPSEVRRLGPARPVPSPSPSVSPSASPTASMSPSGDGSSTLPLALAGLGIAAGLAGSILLIRRRGRS